VGSVVVWDLAKHTCGSLWNFVMDLGFDFMLLDQIANMSLNGLRRRLATRNKTLTEPQMDTIGCIGFGALDFS
jgi:hypothetical protein